MQPILNYFPEQVILTSPQAAWVGGVELVERLAPAHDALALDEPGGARWTIAREFGIEMVPVEMLAETESLFARDCPPPSWPKEASAYAHRGTPQECKVL